MGEFPINLLVGNFAYTAAQVQFALAKFNVGRVAIGDFRVLPSKNENIMTVGTSIEMLEREMKTRRSKHAAGSTYVFGVLTLKSDRFPHMNAMSGTR